MSDVSRRRWPTFLRLAVVVAAGFWLWHNTDPAQLKQVLSTARWRLFVAGLLAFGPAPVLIAVRLKWLLAVHQIHLTVWEAVKVTFAGNFLIQALPVGTPGGDAAKAWYIARDTPHKHEAVTSVFFDRVIGVVGLLLLSGVMVLINWSNPALEHWARQIGVLVLVLALGAGAYFSEHVRRLLRLEQMLRRLPLSGHLNRIDQAVLSFRHRYRRLMVCILLTALLQVVSVTSVFLCGWALGMTYASPWSTLPIYLTYTPICFLTGALPLGVMELTYEQLFVQAAGLGTPEAAYSLSLLSRLMQLIWALPGGLLVIAGRFSPAPATEADTSAGAVAGSRP